MDDNDRKTIIRRRVLAIVFPEPHVNQPDKTTTRDSTLLLEDEMQCLDEEVQFYTSGTTLEYGGAGKFCQICFEAIRNHGVAGSCQRHYFHYNCILTWMMASDRTSSNDCCPTCRQPLYDQALYRQHSDEMCAVLHCSDDDDIQSNSSDSAEDIDGNNDSDTIEGVDILENPNHGQDDHSLTGLPGAADQDVNSLSKLSFTAGVISVIIPSLICGPFAVVVGGVAIYQIKEGRFQEKGTALALCGILTGSVGGAFWTTLISWSI